MSKLRKHDRVQLKVYKSEKLKNKKPMVVSRWFFETLFTTTKVIIKENCQTNALADAGD